MGWLTINKNPSLLEVSNSEQTGLSNGTVVTLTTVNVNVGNLISVGSSRITLKPGKYKLDFSCLCTLSGLASTLGIDLYDVTNSSVLREGSVLTTIVIGTSTQLYNTSKLISTTVSKEVEVRLSNITGTVTNIKDCLLQVYSL